MPTPRAVLEYSPRERLWLWAMAAFGFVVLNGAFIYAVSVEPGGVLRLPRDPLALAFVVETFVMLAALTYLLPKWGVMRLHWGWFLGLSLLGSMAFALPVVLLWGYRKSRTGS